MKKHCERTEECPFFQGRLDKAPALVDYLKDSYCCSDFENCARYKIMKEVGEQAVPANMWPNETTEADKIIKTRKKPE